MKKRVLASLVGVLAAGAVALTGCSSEAKPEEAASGETAASDSNGGTITIGMFNWDEDIAVSYLWKNILEENGYTVKIETADPGPVFQGLADGDYDVVLDVWLPLTHATYLERYDKDIVELGAWNDDAQLTIATNADAPIDSLEELAEKADLFGNELVGIEAGAGLTMTTEDVVIPAYGLEGMDFITSSTPAMLTQLGSSIAKNEDVVVTLWKPHWAYDAYDIKDLKDPLHTLGEAESIYSYGSIKFPSEFPQVAEWLENFKMDSERLHSLENMLFNENDDPANYEDIVAEWVSENQEYVDSLTS